jgi:hypothetical protein
MEKFKSVFSNYLDAIGVEIGTNTKPSEIYDQLRIAYNQGVKGIVECERIFVPQNEDEVDYDILYEIWRNERLHDILMWVNKKIILFLGIADYRTIGVRIRIATAMLNKIVYEGHLSEKLADRIHNNFISSLNREICAINTQDLPF